MSISTGTEISLVSKATQWVSSYAPGFSLEGFTIMNGSSYAIIRCYSNNEIRHVDSHIFMTI